MPFKSIPLWRLQKYKKIVAPDFDIPDALAVTPTPSSPPTRMGREQRMNLPLSTVSFKSGRDAVRCVLIFMLELPRELLICKIHLLLERMAVHHISIVISTMIAAEINLDAGEENIGSTFRTVFDCFVGLFERFLGSVERSGFLTVEI